MTDTEPPTLPSFLLARIAEDEAGAKAATPGPWYWEPPSQESWPQGDEPLRSGGHKEDGYDATVLDAWGHDAYGIDGSDEDRAHIARHDPARVLAECEAKRRIVELLTWTNPLIDSDDRHVSSDDEDRFEQALCLLAVPYSDHPDYDESWRP